MIARELINNSVKPLRTSDTAEFALSMMNDLKVSHLPIVNEDKLLGVISEEDIYEINEPGEQVGNHSLSLKNAFVYEWQHLFDVIKTAHRENLTLIPVLDKKDNYIGDILTVELVFKLSEFFMLDKPGTVLILNMGINDYSLTEISNIVESNNAKILSSSIVSNPGTSIVDVVLKINTTELHSIIQTFERYNYQVKTIFEEVSDTGDLKERYDMLMKYLNV